MYILKCIKKNIRDTSEKKRKEKSLALPDIKTYEKAAVIKTRMSLAQRQNNQENEIEPRNRSVHMRNINI